MVLKFDPNSRRSSRRAESARMSKTSNRKAAAEDRRIAELLGVQPDHLSEGDRYHTGAILAIEKAYGADRAAGREATFAILSEYYSDGYQSGVADDALDGRRLT